MTRPFPNWFEYWAKPFFEKHLQEFAGKPVTFLQIGVYCGDASVWMCDNILTDRCAFLYDVDTWEGSNEEAHKVINFEDVFDYYVSRVDQDNKVEVYRQTSDVFFLRHRMFDTSQFDFVYIDGSHETDQVLRDAVNAEQVLKVGGVMAFDDYTWGTGRNIPKPAIDAFLRCYENKIEIIEKSSQVWIRKIK